MFMFLFFFISERVGAQVVECACVIELPDLKVCTHTNFSDPFFPWHQF